MRFCNAVQYITLLMLVLQDIISQCVEAMCML